MHDPHLSVLSVPVLSQIYLASRPMALQHSVKQLAHSPQRPLLVSRSFSGLLYLERKPEYRMSINESDSFFSMQIHSYSLWLFAVTLKFVKSENCKIKVSYLTMKYRSSETSF